MHSPISVLGVNDYHYLDDVTWVVWGASRIGGAEAKKGGKRWRKLAKRNSLGNLKTSGAPCRSSPAKLLVPGKRRVTLSANRPDNVR